MNADTIQLVTETTSFQNTKVKVKSFANRNKNAIRSTVGNATNACKNVITRNILKKDEAEIDLLEQVKEQIQDSEGKLVLIVDVATGRTNVLGTPEALEEAHKHVGILVKFES